MTVAELEAAIGYAEPKDDLVVEYDDELAADRSDELAEWVP